MKEEREMEKKLFDADTPPCAADIAALIKDESILKADDARITYLGDMEDTVIRGCHTADKTVRPMEL